MVRGDYTVLEERKRIIRVAYAEAKKMQEELFPELKKYPNAQRITRLALTKMLLGLE